MYARRSSDSDAATAAYAQSSAAKLASSTFFRRIALATVIRRSFVAKGFVTYPYAPSSSAVSAERGLSSPVTITAAMEGRRAMSVRSSSPDSPGRPMSHRTTE